MSTVLHVDARSAYPLITPSPRVRVGGYAPFLIDHAVDLRFSSSISDDEYRLLSSGGARRQKARMFARGAARVLRRPPSSDEIFMAHRLLSLVAVPAHDPPPRVDVYDFDDALFHGSISSHNRPFRILKRESQRFHNYLRRARLVLAGNGYLASYAEKHAQHVEILPSCVDPTAQPLRRHGDVEILTVGWMGSGSTAPYLGEILPVLEAINRDGVRMMLVTVGAGLLPARPWLEQHDWTLASQPKLLASFDVGVMPLPDDPWTRGKCGYKLLQYFAAGLPTVASPVGVNRSLLDRGGGLAATSPAEWTAALEHFSRDTSARRQAGLVGRRLVEDEYSYQRWAPELARLLRS